MGNPEGTTEDDTFDQAAWRDQARALIRRRPRVGMLTALILSFVFAALATPIIMTDTALSFLGETEFKEQQPAPATVRIPHFAGFRTAEGTEWTNGAVIIARGEIPDEATIAVVHQLQEKQFKGWGSAVAIFLAIFLLSCLYTTHLRRSHLGKLVRTQVVTLMLILLVAVFVKAAVLMSSVTIFVIPVAGAALVTALVVDVSAALATAVAAASVVGFLVPFDTATLVVLAVQGVAATMALGDEKNKKIRILYAGVIGGIASAIVYLVLCYLTMGVSPDVFTFLSDGDPLRTPWLACIAGGALSGVIAILVHPIYQLLLGDITRSKLVHLEDLSNDLLKQIAEKSPGTWQHSLAMANLAELAANTIGANGRLVRVGAYYHDLGKSIQPSYFIENLPGGKNSPHDQLPPEVSCDAIFAHVTEGVRLAREAGLPERIIDFMHMHHGDGILEYFWTKCEEQGNPDHLSKDRFRYPGVRPQSKETAILAICDAVEAASRTLKAPTQASITNLVQRIVYGKLHLGQLDESGLSMSELRKISNSLIDTIKHAYHGRIEYQWQKSEREGTAGGNPLYNPPLDSLDHPSSNSRRRRALSPVEAAETEEVRPETINHTNQYANQHSDPVNGAGVPQNGAHENETGDTVSLTPGVAVSGPPPATREIRIPTKLPQTNSDDA